MLEFLVERALFASALFSAVAVAFIILFLFRESLPIFLGPGLLDFVLGAAWNPVGSPPLFGALPLVAGTALVTLGAMVFAIPLGVATAVFVSELSPKGWKPLLKLCVEILAGVPSVVYGLFGLVVLTDWIRVSFAVPTGESWLAGSVLLGVMSLPTIISVSEDAISSVLREHKEASLSLGATKWQTIWRVVLPSARSGITAAVVLGMGRAIGETMAVMMVTGNAAVIPSPITNVFSPVRTITGTLGIEMGEVAFGSMHYSALFGLAVLLFVIVLVVNSAALFLLRHRQAGAFGAGRGMVSRAKSFLSGNMVLLAGLAVVALAGMSSRALAASLLVAFALLYLLLTRLRRQWTEKIAFGAMGASFLLVACALAVIIYYVFSNGLPAITPEFLSGFPGNSGRAGGILPAIIGTVYLVAGAIAIALPLGVGAAVYLAEYSRGGRIVSVVRAGIDNLNGVPSIVFGLFGFAFLVIFLKLGVSLLAGQLTLALMVLPTIIRTSEEAIKSVPNSFREGSLALGATKWQTVWRVVLPPSVPGILTGVILGMGRAAGETAPIMFTAAVFSQRALPSSELEPVMALPYHIYLLATSVPGAAGNAYGAALVLLVLVLGMYGFTALIRAGFSGRRNW
ncbi:MAG: phosphate ABC transporter permease subunit PstC [Candidatus ainarchaeum sp.]|nr:phosphate ABC transporter permease subunit PstC [Candidatus ainarchaeum sp.]